MGLDEVKTLAKGKMPLKGVVVFKISLLIYRWAQDDNTFGKHCVEVR